MPRNEKYSAERRIEQTGVNRFRSLSSMIVSRRPPFFTFTFLSRSSRKESLEAEKKGDSDQNRSMSARLFSSGVVQYIRAQRHFLFGNVERTHVISRPPNVGIKRSLGQEGVHEENVEFFTITRSFVTKSSEIRIKFISLTVWILKGETIWSWLRRCFHIKHTVVSIRRSEWHYSFQQCHMNHQRREN